VAATATQMHEHWMQRALTLARRGVGRTRPNPPVGAVVVKAGKRLGEGYHRQAGKPHAEVEALDGLDQKARGATLYVTLEPCCTTGRTPPCTQRIIDCGIARVIISVRDPNASHRGRGLRQLRAAGIEVIEGICRDEGNALLAPFAKWITTGIPYVTLKMGMSLDGRIADSKGNSRWITSPASRREVRRLRQSADAILVGRNTAVTDDPSLRWSAVASRNPKRVILDSTGAVALSAKVFAGDPENTIMVTTARCPEKRAAAYRELGAEVWQCGRGDKVSLPLLLRKLGQAGILHVLCEGGGTLAETLTRGGHVDSFIFFVAPKVLGAGGFPVLGGAGWPLKCAPLLDVVETRQVGPDVLICAVPGKRKAEILKR
jgi:diaminohydroxyphosphoribosylaminopyrimidine deaminase/5-amino-6-(5-phosphoribosylamino)uracil reductase